MKKIIAVLLSVLLVLSVGMLFVSADDATNSVDVHVTIVDEKSEFAVAYETVTVTDHIAEFTAANYSSGDVIRVEGSTTNDTLTFS